MALAPEAVQYFAFTGFYAAGFFGRAFTR